MGILIHAARITMKQPPARFRTPQDQMLDGNDVKNSESKFIDHNTRPKFRFLENKISGVGPNSEGDDVMVHFKAPYVS